MTRECHVRFCEGGGVRFPSATRLVILARSVSPALLGFVDSTLEGWLGVKINRSKTRVVTLRQEKASLDFLGFTFWYDRDRYGRARRYLNVRPSAKAVTRERGKLWATLGTQRAFCRSRSSWPT